MKVALDTIKDQITQQGFARVANVYSATEIDILKKIFAASVRDNRAGRRQLNQLSAEILACIHTANLKTLIHTLLGTQAGLVRSLFFNKSQQANWHVGWHQDRTIAVDAISDNDVTGFTGWSKKNNVAHVQAPAYLLASMLSCRVHLDPTDQANGALRLLPYSHLDGLLNPKKIIERVRSEKSIVCTAAPGDVLLMRPLLAHASNKAVSTHPRRVLHLEYANCALPAPLDWHAKVAL